MFLSLFILAFLICSLKKLKRLHSTHFLQKRQHCHRSRIKHCGSSASSLLSNFEKLLTSKKSCFALQQIVPQSLTPDIFKN